LKEIFFGDFLFVESFTMIRPAASQRLLTIAVIASVCAFRSVSAFLPSSAPALQKLANQAPAKFLCAPLRRSCRSSSHSHSSSSNALQMATDAKNVLIIGAGPAGLLAAHHLLLKGEPGTFKVTVAERRADPSIGVQASLRSYSLGLGVRGRAAIKKASSALWEIVKSRGVECEKFSLHIGSRVLQIRQESPVLITEPSVLINRADLCAALLQGFRDPARMPTLKFQVRRVSICTFELVKQVN